MTNRPRESCTENTTGAQEMEAGRTADKEALAEREAFEQWARKELSYLSGPFLRDCNDPEPDRTYEKWDVEICWKAWQARASRERPVAESEVVECIAEIQANGWVYGAHPKDKARIVYNALLAKGYRIVEG